MAYSFPFATLVDKPIRGGNLTVIMWVNLAEFVFVINPSSFDLSNT